MNINRLHFFDKSGYELNFDWNENRGCWEGNIYLPKVSVGLYANTSIYVLEDTIIGGVKKYVFPKQDNTNSEISFSWDILNKFVDEFFMFTFDSSYIQEDTSSLTYIENDGPDCEPLLITRFDEYRVPLSSSNESKALPIHVAFIALERYDANTYKRTLVMKSNFETIARINFFAETIEEDERLRIWNSNLGYDIKPEDEMLFKSSNIKEPYPDYNLLNQKRKELMIEGHNIYPYIGSYKALINAIKFFGYDNLNIVEFWRNINEEDENYGKIYHVKKYTLTDNEVIFVNNHKIILPSIDYKKLSNIALSYKINKPTYELENDTDTEDEENTYDIFELPHTQEYFEYTIEESIIKLFALRDKLNKDFLPGRSKIIDIIGEGNYFGLCGIKHNSQFGFTSLYKSGYNLSIESYPSTILRITQNKLFKEYIFSKKIDNWNNQSNLNQSTLSSKITGQLNEIDIKNETKDVNNYIDSEEDKCNLYTNFYKDLNENYTITDIDTDDDLFDYYEETNGDKSYNINKNGFLENSISAKVILKNTSFSSKTFGDMTNSFGNIHKYYTFKNIDTIDITHIRWDIRYSKDQIDTDFKNINVSKDFNNNGTDDIISKKKKWYSSDKEWTSNESDCIWCDKKEGSLDDYNEVFFELPYTGYYDVKLSITDNFNNITSMVFSKYIKVEPYNLDIRGFYYDARKIPDELLKKLRYIQMFDETTSSDSDSDSDSDNAELGEYYYYNLDEQIDDLSWQDYTTGDVYDYKYYLEMRDFILDKIQYLTSMAETESTTTNIDEMSMPVYKTNFESIIISNKSYTKYYNKDIPTKFRVYKIEDASQGKYRYIESNYKGEITSTSWSSIVKSIEGTPRVSSIDIVNQGPYTFNNLNEEWQLADNISPNITILIPNVHSARYIKNGVDVKPYTWILLGYNNSKISGKCNPHWIIENTTTNKQKFEHYGKFLTILLKEEGNYTVTLSIEDINGNTYDIKRNIIIVSKDADYKLYTPFGIDYGAYFDEQNTKRLKIIKDAEKLYDATYGEDGTYNETT